MSMAQTMADNEERRYRERIGEPAWQMLQEVRAEHGQAAVKAARMLDDYLDRGVIPKSACTCMSELEEDAYGAGGPMSGKPRPPLCRVHPYQDGRRRR